MGGGGGRGRAKGRARRRNNNAPAEPQRAWEGGEGGGRGRGRAKAGESCAGKGELRRPGSDSRRVLVLCHAQPPHSLVRIGPGVKCV